MATGRPSKFEKFKDIILKMAELGLTDEQMAMCAGITPQTLANWKKKNKDFFESLKNSKAISDARVEKSLFERALGYSCKEDRIFNDNGTPIVVPTTKNYPPDVTACIFWLKNRQPDKWREKQDVNLKVDSEEKIDFSNLSNEELEILAKIKK